MTTRSLELAIAEAARPGRGLRGGTTKFLQLWPLLGLAGDVNF